MRRFFRICENLNVEDLVNQLEDHPELWGVHKFRTDRADSPFHYAPDIWVRYRDFSELKEPKNYLEPHFGEFYPAWDVLTELRPIVFAMMYLTEAVHLGGILITRIPVGSKVGAHHDGGSWHAEYTDCKAFITLKGGKGCTFRCAEDEQEFKVGDAWTFNNLLTHSVENNGEEDQITLIVSMRSASGNYLNMKQ